MKTVKAGQLLKTYRDVVGRLQHEAAVPTTDGAGSDFLDIAQSVEHQELARLTATRLAERARRLHHARRLVAIPDATTCVACQERLEQARS